MSLNNPQLELIIEKLGNLPPDEAKSYIYRAVTDIGNIDDMAIVHVWLWKVFGLLIDQQEQIDKLKGPKIVT